MLEAIGRDLAAEFRWQESEAAQQPVGEMVEIFNSTENVFKSQHYLPIYESALSRVRTRPIKMLEIGVDRGGSLQMWRRYLHPESVIVGIDINPAASQYDNRAQDIHVRIGSQQDIAFLQNLISEFGAFDVILDDGSHMTSHMVKTFRWLFPNGLASGGIYIVEDIGTNYQKSWRDDPMTFVDFTKWLIDAMHARCQGRKNLRQIFANLEDPSHLQDYEVFVATTILEKIEFYESIALFHRADGHREMPRSVWR